MGNAVVMSPTLVKQICEAEVNEKYLDVLNDLSNKLDYVKANLADNSPVVAQSAVELERLRMKAISRVKDALLQKITALGKPRTNPNVLQLSVLVPFSSCY